MTAKEKTESLVSVYKHKVSGSMDGNLAKNHAKQCALIAVDQMISELDYTCGSIWKDNKDRTRSFTYEGKLRLKQRLEYWKEVKAEIEKL